ncbi:hypothetical protein QE429_000490 [Bacillus sp. SORGH_AS 510]|uniref:hypothetical protein n=1 Tax=Bacillus sp. SORGH_AS_0510 TaxID=3041771 RepID=UPI002787FE7F|nr:hypothetical protein [Bacillus sp. SORGH_AS_0510]MDQ1143663.1 hypothetical protein [Bacillus sp. SORGH_AS_0510]
MNVLIPFLMMVVPILLFFALINYLYYKNWTSIYIALDDKSYFRAISKLKQAGIRYRTKNSFNQTNTPMFGGIRQRHYEIYVKDEDVNHANAQLHSKR